MPAFEALGIRVVALSYDEPDALKDFQDAYSITHTLLSDPDSRVIRDYGILNTLIAEDDQYIREGLQDLLQSEGYKTITAVDGSEAVTKYHEESQNNFCA